MDKARIALAKAIYIGDGETLNPQFKFNPFTDANDDYAVLQFVLKEWDAEKLDAFREAMITAYGNLRFTRPWYYKIGDYARAACKVLEMPLE